MYVVMSEHELRKYGKSDLSSNETLLKSVRKSENDVFFFVGYFRPDGHFNVTLYTLNKDKAEERVHYLNGGSK